MVGVSLVTQTHSSHALERVWCKETRLKLLMLVQNILYSNNYNASSIDFYFGSKFFFVCAIFRLNISLNIEQNIENDLHLIDYR